MLQSLLHRSIFLLPREPHWHRMADFLRYPMRRSRHFARKEGQLSATLMLLSPTMHDITGILLGHPTVEIPVTQTLVLQPGCKIRCPLILIPVLTGPTRVSFVLMIPHGSALSSIKL